MLPTLLRRLSRALLWFAAGSIVLVLVFRWVPPPGTALMVERKVQSWVNGQSIDLQRDWEPWENISDELKVAVIAGEDQKFASHWGSTSRLSRRPWPTTSVAAVCAVPAP